MPGAASRADAVAGWMKSQGEEEEIRTNSCRRRTGCSRVLEVCAAISNFASPMIENYGGYDGVAIGA